MVGKMIAAHAVLGLQMTDHWFDGGAPPQLDRLTKIYSANPPSSYQPTPIRNIVSRKPQGSATFALS
jgi:hypothetical protein